MNIRKFYIIIVLLLLPMYSFADRYGMYDPSDEYFVNLSGFSFNEITAKLILLYIVYISYKFLLDSYKNWNSRKSNNEKPNMPLSISDWLSTIVGYLIVSFFLVLPILVTIKFMENSQALRDNWFWLQATAFIAICYLRKT